MAPASPKEKRRSTRRSAHSSSKSSGSSGSPSPETPPLPPPPPASDAARSAASSSAPAARGKRAKDDTDDFQAPAPSSHRRTTSVTSTVNGAPPAPTPSSASSKRTKRKGKENIAPVEEPPPVVLAEVDDSKFAEVVTDGEKTEEDGGVTRCVCEGLDDDADAPEFMIQCEQCMAWQHGPCMGFSQESDIPEGDYYCEQCRPEDHVELLKRLARRQRHSSEKSAQASQKSRTSRSHSPAHFLKTTKRRNTMNSRDAAYEESIRELLDATAAEAAPMIDTPAKDRAESVAKTEEPYEETIENGPGGRKKRKRAEDDVMPTKRKRSASVASEGHGSAVTGQDKPEATTPITTALLPPPAPSGKSRARRGGGKKSAAVHDASVNGEGEDGASTTRKHPNQYTYRAKAPNGQSRRAPHSGAGQNQQGGSSHDHGTRRNANNASNSGGSGSGSRNNHNAYYNNVQLPMFSNWGLPDYLAHLQSILPSDIPPPLQIRGASSFLRRDLDEQQQQPAISTEVPNAEINGRASVGPPPNENADAQSAQMASALASATESVTERGVKVKWPAKRMSVGDMNKRVRALVEWVGREQALALDRERRKVALEKALQANLESRHLKSDAITVPEKSILSIDTSDETSSKMDVDDSKLSTKAPEKEQQDPPSMVEPGSPAIPKFSFSMGLSSSGTNGTTRPSTSKMMEELMEELISFQERFGPSAKGQSRDRRVAVMS